MSPQLHTGLVSPSDIAGMAGVSRGAVSNWRKRASDFPQPIAGTSSKPLFSLQEVSDWLRSNGHSIKRDQGETAVWSAMNLLRDDLPVEESVELLMTLAVARKRGTRPPTEFPTLRPEILERVDQAIAGVDVSDYGAMVDFTLERLAKAQAKMGSGFGFIGSRTSTLLANIAANRPGGVLYDPACGIAVALIEAVEAGARPDRVVGHEINLYAIRTAAQRAELHDVAIELEATDVLAEDIDPRLQADTVILDPPFGMRLDRPGRRLMDNRFEFGPPPRTSADTAWFQHAIAHLTETGRAYVLSPAVTLARGGEEGKIRAELVRQGCIEAVVGLPGKMLPHTSMPLALWVLRRPDHTGSAGVVLVIDASEATAPEACVHKWLSDAEERRAVPHVSVPIADVLAADAVLSPQRWVDQTEPDPADVISTYQDGWIRIHRSMQQVQNALSSFEYVESDVRSRVMTVGALVEHGILELRLGRPKDRYDDAPKSIRERIITASDVRDGRLGATPLQPRDNNPDWTHEGDVLVTTMHTVRARVDDIGGHIPSTGVYRLRVRDREVLSPEYLASVLTGSWNDRFQGGSTIQRAHVKDLEVPLLPIDEQRSIHRALSTLGVLREHATHMAEGASAVAASLLESIRYNAPLSESADSKVVSGADGAFGPREAR